jgi:hypothetical protein
MAHMYPYVLSCSFTGEQIILYQCLTIRNHCSLLASWAWELYELLGSLKNMDTRSSEAAP